jgi:DNA-binding CsgD family transcriptional regulator
MPDFDALVGAIYDCAVNPELWSETLVKIRDKVGAAYALVGYIDATGADGGIPPISFRRNSPWSEEWLFKIEEKIRRVPFDQDLFHGPIDASWTAMMTMPEEEFKKTDIYREWVAPQDLLDTLNICYLNRSTARGVLAMPGYASRGLYGPDDRAFIERISPHIRRSIMINGLVDRTNMTIAFYRNVIDALSSAVFVVGMGRRVVFTNAASEAMLEDGNVLSKQFGALKAANPSSNGTVFEDAIDRASKGDIAVGIRGIGVPLIGKNGDRLAAYVLPIAGKDVRGAMMAQGQCIVFVAQRAEHQPMVMEILRTMFDLTVSEARVAALVAKGDGPQDIAASLGVAVNTVRAHLKHAFAKTGTHDQPALGALVNGLLPPVA